MLSLVAIGAGEDQHLGVCSPRYARRLGRRIPTRDSSRLCPDDRRLAARGGFLPATVQSDRKPVTYHMLLILHTEMPAGADVTLTGPA